MINVSDILLDPDICQSFTVYRSSGKFGEGGWKENAPQTLTLQGVVYPSTAKELQQVPEGDRVQGMMTFVSPSQMFATHLSGEPGTSDQPEWNGERYRVVQLLPYSDYGAYVAIAARMEGD